MIQCVNSIMMKMTSVKMLCFIFVTAIISSISADILEEGDNCVNALTRSRGRCLRFGDCKSAVIDVKLGRRPQICSFIGNVSVVCCPRNDREDLLSIPSPTITKYVATPLSVVGCSPPSERAYNRTQTGSKARDHCIDLVKTILRCKNIFENCPREQQFYTSIVGGKPTSVNEFPHMALLGFGQRIETASWECGGSLISNRWVMTAGHCIYSRSVGTDVKYVRLGLNDLNEPIIRSKVFHVALIVDHPDRRPPQKYDDIALLQLDREVVLSPSMIPACIHFGPDSINSGVVTGWGVTQSRGKQSNILQQVTLQQVQYEECTVAHPPSPTNVLGIYNRTQICYGSSLQLKDACQGDSGGPLQIVNNDDCVYTVFGIVSIGKGCAIRGIPGIYTRVAAYVPWIESIVWP